MQTKMDIDDEAAFLDAYRADDYDRPSVSVDVALLTYRDNTLQAAVIQRQDHPYQHHWTLPGVFVRIDESLEAAARRALITKTGLAPPKLAQLATFGDPRRDPRLRVISVVYYALLPEQTLLDTEEMYDLAQVLTPQQTERGEAQLLMKNKPISVGFDHALIIGDVVRRLRGRLQYAPVAQQLLPTEFTLGQLQQVHEAIGGRRLNKAAFRRKLLATNSLHATGRLERNVRHRPAALYRAS